MKDFDFFANISDLIPSNKGGKKESIYKKSALDEMSGKSSKNKRDKLRKSLVTFCSSVSTANDKNAKRIFVEFEKFYKEFFVTNDYSFNSVCSTQRKETEKEIISKGMDIFAKIAKVNNAKIAKVNNKDNK